jgi:hypothetical protein
VSFSIRSRVRTVPALLIAALDSARSSAREEVHESWSLDDLGEIVAGLLPRASHLVSDGGDGALHWLINEVRRQAADSESWPAFVPSNAGTIDSERPG